MLNEHDIKDYQSEFADYQPESIERKLYEIPRGSIFQVLGYKPKYLFEKIDGAYSLCYTLPDRQLLHFAAWTPVFICKKADD